MGRRRDGQAAIFAHELEMFQARVVRPVLQDLAPIPPEAIGGPRKTLVQTARDNSHNQLCYMARLSFALTIGAAYERNLRLWLTLAAPGRREAIQRAGRPALIGHLQQLKAIDLSKLDSAGDLAELWEVVSMARHGDGLAAARVAADNPGFWSHNAPDLQARYDDGSFRVQTAQISNDDLARYCASVIAFWHWAERNPAPAR
jgi:hypothetical protein